MELPKRRCVAAAQRAKRFSSGGSKPDYRSPICAGETQFVENGTMATHNSSAAYQWPNWLNLVLAIWLFISPWVIGFAYGAAGAGAVVQAGPGVAAWNAWVIAIIVGVLSIAAIAKLAVWEDWINLVLAVWLFFSPWILGYAGLQEAMWNSLVVGFLMAVFGIWGIVAARSVLVRT